MARAARSFVMWLSAGGMVVFALNVAAYAVVGLVVSGPAMLFARATRGSGLQAARFGNQVTWLMVGVAVVAGVAFQAWSLIRARDAAAQPSGGCATFAMVTVGGFFGGWFVSVLVVGAIGFGASLWMEQIFDVPRSARPGDFWGTPESRETVWLLATNTVFFGSIATVGMYIYKSARSR